MKQKRRFFLMLAFFGLSVCAMAATYRIDNYSSSLGGFPIYEDGTYKSAPANFQNAMQMIRGYANGANCTIQFENGTLTFNLGSAESGRLIFDSAGSPNWGTITVTGKLTSSYVNATNGAVRVNGSVVLIWNADLANTAAGGIAFYKPSESTATTTFSGGTISATSGIAIRNFSAAALNITGGTVSATTGEAIRIGTACNVTVSGGTVTSANTNGESGTIVLSGTASSNAVRLKITGGTVRNTSSGNVILNTSAGAVTVSGGLVRADGGVAICNTGTGTINITGGTVRGYSNARAIFNTSSGEINISSTGNETRVQTANAISIDNGGTGKITITGPTTSNAYPYISSSLTNTNYGTIFLYNIGTSSVTRLEITGGTIWNTSDDGGGNTIRNNSTGEVKISGGRIYENSTGKAIWNAHTGKVTISGGTVENISGAGVAIWNSSTGAVNISNGIVRATYANGRAINNSSSATITISGGTVSASGNGGRAIVNTSSGPINMSGGTVSSTNWVAIDNGGSSSGAINISGGEVKATTGIAVWNNSTGKVTISGTATITSENTGTTNGGTYHGTIRLMGTGGLTVNGGTIRNTATGHAIHNNSTGPVTVSNGVVLAKEGKAINNASSGTITFSKGIVFAYGATATDIISSTYSGATANTALVGWNKAAGNNVYEVGSTTDIFKQPSTVSATWENQGTTNGIMVSAGTTSGFIQIAGITVGDVGIESISQNNGMQVYPNPTSGQFSVRHCGLDPQSPQNNGMLKQVQHDAVIEILDITGRIVHGEPCAVNRATVEIDISHLPNGIYFVKVGNETIKIVKR